MDNPFRNEQSAFRLVLVTAVAFGLIALASWINAWLGLATFIVLTTAVVFYFVNRPGPPQEQRHVEHVGAPDEHRVILVADEAIDDDALVGYLRERGRTARERVLVVAPALNSPSHQLVSDVDGARAEAQARLDHSLEALASAGIAAEGRVGAADPVLAIDDAVRTFGADEIVIALPPHATHWHEQEVVARVRERFDVPVREFVVGTSE